MLYYKKYSKRGTAVKIIHTGDIHLGSALRNLPMDKANIRKAELMESFRRLCAYAKQNGVAAVLIAGDLFDENKTAESVRRDAFATMKAASPVCFFYVSGNHDDGLYFDGEIPNNVYLFSQNHGWQSYDLPENITVTGIDGKNLRPDKYAELYLRADRFNILMMHGDVRRGQNGQGEEIALAKLQNRNVDYLALGHIHIPMLQVNRLDGRGAYRYCGCLEGRGFDEVGARGFFLLEIVGGRLQKDSFVSFAKRQVTECAVDISACKNYYEVERAVLEGMNGVRRDDIVKIILKGRHCVGLRKDVTLLAARIAQYFFHVKIVDESRIYIDYTAFQNDLSERGEFVREVARYEMSEEDRAEILDVGLKALAGEDIDL